MGDLIRLAAWLSEHRLMILAPAWSALAATGYIWLELEAVTGEVTGVTDAVVAIQVSQLEERLDATFSALCMAELTGDAALLQRIRDLQAEYVRLTGARYVPPPCNLLLKIR